MADYVPCAAPDGNGLMIDSARNILIFERREGKYSALQYRLFIYT
jgi:hypothetical protein